MIGGAKLYDELLNDMNIVLQELHIDLRIYRQNEDIHTQIKY